MHQKNIRIGIDVGGTFTHIVALTTNQDPTTPFQLIATSKVPTTHNAPIGVAQGIINALKEILDSDKIKIEEIAYIAHATTQATNALLEGDICPVGILAIGSGIEGKFVLSQTNLEKIPLTPDINLTIFHEFINLTAKEELSEEKIIKTLEILHQKGARSFVAASAFSVDNPELEDKIVASAHKLSYPATATHEISQLYGLKARTRTAAINAALLPKMMDTAEKTQKAIQELKIKAPLLIMRSDGGAMQIEEMKKRPILTLLSGPAAGIAAALMAVRISDGIFLEVGGTSTDISCIINGHPTLKMAQIGEHKLYLNTLDARTLGIAGGSLVKIKNNKIIQIGPRSAHIQGFQYASFTTTDSKITPEKFPLSNNHFYLIAKPNPIAPPIAITPTCAVDVLPDLPKDPQTPKNNKIILEFLTKMADFLGLQNALELAKEILKIGSIPIIKTVQSLIDEYHLEKEHITLVGGGGGAHVWVPYVGKTMGYPSNIVEHAPVISAIGAALALLQESLERTIINPKAEDILEIRKKAENALLKAGASPQSIEVRIEVDTKRGILRAIATGCEQLSLQENNLSLTELQKRAQNLLCTNPETIKAMAQHTNFVIFQGIRTQKTWLGLKTSTLSPWTVIDRKGRIRLSARHGKIITVSSEILIESIPKIISEESDYNDAGLILPNLFMITDTKIIDLTGLTEADQILAIIKAEKESIPKNSLVSIVIKER